MKLVLVAILTTLCISVALNLYTVIEAGLQRERETVLVFILIRLNEWESCSDTIEQCLLYFGCLELRLVSKSRYFCLDIIGSVHVQTIQP